MATTTSKKQYTLVVTRYFFYNRPSDEHEVSGTLEELTKYFSYTLEVGNSWDHKIPTNPRTIKSLLSALEKSYEIKNNGMTSVKLKEAA